MKNEERMNSGSKPLWGGMGVVLTFNIKSWDLLLNSFPPPKEWTICFEEQFKCTAQRTESISVITKPKGEPCGLETHTSVHLVTTDI